MIKEDVKHLFDRSACLTKRQIEAYLSGNMITEEVYAIEHHINGCPLCSMAMDGMQLRKDALEVSAGLNTDFLNDHFTIMPQRSTSSAASYVKDLKPREINTKPLMTALKLIIAVGACAAILWFVQSVGKNKNNAPAEAPKQEEVVNTATPPQQEEQTVMVEEPLMADTQASEQVPTPVEQAPAKEQPVIGPPPPPVEKTPAVVAKPVTTKPVATTTKPLTTATKPLATTKPVTTPPKQTPVASKPVVPSPTPVAKKEEPPKPAPKQEDEPKPQAKAEEPKPAPKKEEAEDLPADPIAAGKALMDKRSYNAAINRMRNEMRSNNKGRRQEAVILVAKCYQQLGNKDRAAELLKSVVDEGGPEKKNAKKLLKEVDKNAKVEE